MGAADSNLKDSNMDTLTTNMDQDQIATSPVTKELAKQLGVMTLKNIVRHSPEKTISLQDLCNQFITQAEETEKEALGLETSDVIEALKQYPGLFTISEGGEGAISVQLVNDICIPPLLSAVVKVKGKLKDAGTLSVEDLSRWFQENCTSEEIEAFEKGDSEFLKKTLLSLPSIFCLLGDQISLVLSKEDGKVTELKDDETHADDDDEEEEDKNGIGEEEEEGHQLSNDKLNNDQNSASVNKTEIELSREVDYEMLVNSEKVAAGDRHRNVEDGENIQEQDVSDKGIPLSDDKAIGVEVLDNHDGVDDKDIGVEGLDNHDGGTHSDIQADELKGKYDVSEEEESKSEEDDVDVVGDESQQSTASVNLSLSSGDSSSSPISVGVANVSAVEEEEEEEDISTKFTKQLGIMKIKNILKERGRVSLQVLNAMFGNKGTKEERDVVGRKADKVLETLTQFKDIFVFESHPERGGNLPEQQFVRLKESSEEISLALARAVLKIPGIIEERGNLNANQLSTLLNQRSSVAEKAAVGKSPLLLKETLLALPTVITFSGEKVCVISNNLPNEQLLPSEQKPQAASAEPSVPAVNTAAVFDDAFVYKHLGMLKLKDILQRNGSLTLQKLCSEFGGLADDNEREAVGWRAMVVLQTVKEFPSVFAINLPRKVDVQNLVDRTKVYVKPTATNQTPVPYARAMLKLIWYLKQKGTMLVTQLSSLLGQNSTVEEREAVGKSPGSLKATLKTLPQMFSVSSDKISVVNNAHIYALKQFVLCMKTQPATKAAQKPAVQPAQGTELMIPDDLKRTVVATVTECLYSRGGSCDVTILTAWIKRCGSAKEKKVFGDNGSCLLKVLKTMPHRFIFQGSKVRFASSGEVEKNTTSGGASGFQPHNVSVPQLVNPVPIRGALPMSQAKVIPSIELVFDTKNTGASGWGDISVSQASTSSVPGLSYAKVASGIPPLMSTSSQSGEMAQERVKQFYMDKNAQRLGQKQAASSTAKGIVNKTPPTSNSKATSKATKAKHSALQNIIAYLEQVKIATILQLGGRLSKLTAEERKAIGKSPGLLYDTLVTMPDKFIIVGPFVGVKSQAALVTGIAKLVNYVESKGKCKITSLPEVLGQKGINEEIAAIGKDMDIFSKTISGLTGIFIVEENSVYLNNGKGGQPSAPTPMNKATATNEKIGWVKSAGTVLINVTPVLNQTAASVPIHIQAPSKPVPLTIPARQDSKAPIGASYTLHVVAITDEAMCQEFVDECLAKYEYPIISVSVRKKWVAIAGWEGQVYMFDMEGYNAATASPDGFRILADAISSDKILKVVQDCRYVSSVLYECFGMKLANVFDTKVAYQLLTGESNVTLDTLCNEYDVAVPREWNAILSNKASAAAETASRPPDVVLGAWVRVLIPQIYQHMVMKFSSDSLQEVGKLCEAFLHQEGTKAASSALPVSSKSALPVSSDTHPSATSHKYAKTASPPDTSTVTTQVNQSLLQEDLTPLTTQVNKLLLHSDSTPLTTEVNQSLLQVDCISFEATQSKVCSYLKQNGPSSVMKLYEMIHGTANVSDDLESFQKTLLKTSSRYILLESGVVDLVEHVQSSAAAKIICILEGKGVLESAQLLRHFKEVATVDEVKVVATTKSAFLKTLTLMAIVCVLKDRKVCLRSDVRKQVVSKVADYVKQSGSIDVEELTRWFQKRATTEELQVCQEGLLDVLNAEKDVFYVHNSLVEVIADGRKGSNELVSDYLPAVVPSRRSGLAEHPENLEDNDPIGISKVSREIQDGYTTWRARGSTSAIEIATEFPQENCQKRGSNVDQRRCTDLGKPHEASVKTDVTVSFSQKDDNISGTATADAGLLTEDDLVTLQHYTEENGPTTISQLQSLLHKTTTVTVKRLKTALRCYKDLFTFTKRGLVYSNEAKFTPVLKIANYLEDRGISTIEDVRDWFCLHVPRQEKSAFPVCYDICEFKKYLERFPHIFVLGEYGENSVSVPHNFSSETILPQDTDATPTKSYLEEAQVDSDGIDESSYASEIENEPVTSRRKRKRASRGKCRIGTSKQINLLQFYVDTNGPKSMEDLHKRLQTIVGSDVSYEELQEVLTFDASISSFIKMPSGLVSSPIQLIASFLERKGSSNISSIYGWVVDSYGESEFESSEKAVLERLNVLSHIFDVGRKGKHISLQPHYVSSRMKINADGSGEDISLSTPIYNKLGFLTGSYMKPLWIYLEQNGPTDLVELLGLVHQRLGSEDIITKEELRRNIKAYIYNMNFTISRNSDLVEPNRAKQQGAKKVAQFIETSDPKSIAEVWEWFDLHGSLSEKRSLGETQQAFTTKLKAMPSVFDISRMFVSLNSKYQCNDTYQPEDVSAKSVDELCACETMGATGSQNVLSMYDDRVTGFGAEKIRITRISEGSVSAHSTVTESSQKDNILILMKKGSLRKTFKELLHNFVELNGPSTPLQLHSELHKKIGEENVMSLEELKKALQNSGSFKFQSSGLVELVSNEVRLAAVNKVVQFLEMNGPCSISDVHSWFCQRANQHEMKALRATKTAARFKNGLKSFPFMLLVENDNVALHPDFLHNKSISSLGACGETMKATGSHDILLRCDVRETRSGAEDESSASASATVTKIDTSSSKQHAFIRKNGNLRKKLKDVLQIHLEQNGPATLLQLHTVLHKHIGRENAISLEELKKPLQKNYESFKFLPSGLVELVPNEVQLAAVNKVVLFLEINGACSIHDVHNWFCQHANQSEMGALRATRKVTRFKNRLKKFSFMLLVENDSVALHPDFRQKEPTCSSKSSIDKGSSQVHSIADDLMQTESEGNLRVDFSDEDADILATSPVSLYESQTDMQELATESDIKFERHSVQPKQMGMSSDPPYTCDDENNDEIEPWFCSTGEEQAHPSHPVEDYSCRFDGNYTTLPTFDDCKGGIFVHNDQLEVPNPGTSVTMTTISSQSPAISNRHDNIAASATNCSQENQTKCSTRTVVTRQHEEDVTTSENSLQSTKISTSEEQGNESIFLDFTGFLKNKYILLLIAYVIQNGPTGLTELQHVLMKQTGTENVLSLEKLEESLHHHHTKFTFLSSGLIGPNEIMMRAADKIANILKLKGTSTTAELLYWYNWQYGSEEEKVALCLSTKEGVKKNLKLFPNMFVIGNGSVALHQDYTPRETSPLSTITRNQPAPARISLPQQNEPFLGRSGFLKNKYVEPLQIHINQNGPTSLSELQKVLYHVFGNTIALSSKELRNNLHHHGTLFVFLSDGRIGPNDTKLGPNDTKLQALNKIVEFLEKEGPSSIVDVRKWYRQLVEEELSTCSLSQRKSLKTYLKKYPHIIVIGENKVELQPDFKDAIPSTMADKTSTSIEDYSVQEKCHERTLETSQFGWSAFKTEVSLSSERTMGCSENEGTLETSQFGWSAFDTEVSLSSERTMRCSEKDRSMKEKCPEVPAISETAKYGLRTYATEASLSSGRTVDLSEEENLQTTSGSYQNEEAVMQHNLVGEWNETNLIIPSTSNPSSTPDPKTSSSLLTDLSHTMSNLSTSPDHLITTHVSHDDSGFEATSFVPGYALNAARVGVFECNGDQEVLNPWDITQQLRDEFASKNKQDMDKLMAVFGEDISRHLTQLSQSNSQDHGLTMLTEVVLDYGRFAQARFYQKSSPSGCLDVKVSSDVVTKEDIESILESGCVTSPTADNRAGIEGTLHRLGIISNRSGHAIGLTACIGRPVLGCVDHIYDLLKDGQSVMLLGSPGVGMTTVLREISRVLSDVKKRRVVVIDTYNQIGGDSDVPHPAIGSARRLQVVSGADQYKVMIEALKNHNPQTVIIDEIATVSDAQGVRNLVQRGVQVIATAHSCNFVDFFQNHKFKHVSGMVQGADGGGKALPERVQDPAFQVLIELNDRDTWIIHKDLASSIDLYLQGMRPIVQERQQTPQYDNKGALIGQQCTVKLIEATVPSLLGM